MQHSNWVLAIFKHRALAFIYLLLITRAALYSNERYFQTTTNNNNKSFDVNRYNLLQLNMPLKQQCTLAIERIEILLIEV